LRGYLECSAAKGLLAEDATETSTLLELFVLDKAIYELRYELENRPAWLWLPLGGVVRTLRGWG